MDSSSTAVDSSRIGVVGAGTMGSGIALAALLSDFKVVLFDVDIKGLERAREYIRTHLDKKHRSISIQYLTTSASLDDFNGCSVVIEAAPEKLQLKQELFAQLDKICPPPAILATNTSTLAVTAIAAASETPGRVAGMHFFNPAPVLPLVEVIRGAGTDEDTVDKLVGLAQKMGKTPVVAGDTPGFIVNRVARPFYGEALRLLGEGAATHEIIDRLVREGAGFRMGPFELMDLIGIDINFAATQSMYEQTFGEPRYRPSLVQSQMVMQKALGRKSGRGFYRYEGNTPVIESAEPVIHTGEPPQGAILVSRGTWAPGVAESCRENGLDVWESLSGNSAPAAALISAGREEGLREILISLDQNLPASVPLVCQCADAILVEAAAWIENHQRLVGFDGLLFRDGKAVTLAANPGLSTEIRTKVEGLFAFLGKRPIWIKDTPGLILPRIISMLANEAAFAVGEGVAEAETIDRAMQLGTNYPKGPLAWAKELGYDKIVAVLEHLRGEYGEDRYRTAPLLRYLDRSARLNQSPFNFRN
jgi:3-hydroxybutyryl-CoA dehydrogenase